MLHIGNAAIAIKEHIRNINGFMGGERFMTVRRICRKVNDVERQMLTSMTDAMRYPAANVAELYKHRWGIELGYREAKQYLLGYHGHHRALCQVI